MSDEWRDQALCRGMDTNLFYPIRGTDVLAYNEAIASAKAICKRCPVQLQCRTEAVLMGDNFGVQGGMDPKERIDWATATGVVIGKRLQVDLYRNAPPHGTPAGYQYHRRHDKKPCEECRTAHSAAIKHRKRFVRELAVVEVPA